MLKLAKNTEILHNIHNFLHFFHVLEGRKKIKKSDKNPEAKLCATIFHNILAITSIATPLITPPAR